MELELTHEGYEVEKSFDGRDGLEKLESGAYGGPAAGWTRR